jgi:hypothetical protein
MYHEIGCWRCVIDIFTWQCLRLVNHKFSDSWDVCAGVVIAREAGCKVSLRLACRIYPGEILDSSTLTSGLTARYMDAEVRFLMGKR